jgi:hypothetical protein
MRNSVKKYTFFSLLFVLFLALFQATIQTAPTYDIRVTDITFFYGGGKGPTGYGENNSSYYYRTHGQPGTIINITAEMNTNSIWQPMYGNVTFTVQYTDGSQSGTFNVVISNGNNTGRTQIPYNDSTGFQSSWLTAGSTTQWTYTVTAVSGNFSNGTISSNTSNSILWDYQDPPTDSTFPPATETDVGTDLTATTAKLFWTPVSTSTTISGRNNEDFYEYRVKFREYSEETVNSWRTWNGNNDPTLRNRSNNPTPWPTDDTATHFDNGRKYTTLPNLKIFTQYEYYIEAVDVFGNVTAPPDPLFIFSTQPYSIIVELTDGITTHTVFTDLSAPETRDLNEANIQANLQIVSSDTPPDAVRIWYTAVDDTINIVNTNQTVNESAFAENTLFSVDAVALSANEWVAYMSSDTAAITNGNTVRFVVETQSGGEPVFADYDVSDLDPNDDEWTFSISKKPESTPRPVRILNNVITDKNPRAYPSYYLTDDAYVTIRVFDIKGRQVASILENGFRRGGYNIKEGGWRGINKSGYKLGVGLYYIKIVAKRASDGKIILNETKKVVMAK